MTAPSPANTSSPPANAYDALAERGLIAQATHEDMRERLARPLVAYCGFDPTADSLHVGSLVPIMALAHLQRCGHRPVVVIGGATGLVGDPSGKTEARQMLTPEQIDRHAEAIAGQIGRIVRFDGSASNAAVLVNNADWLAGKGWIEMLREVGSQFSVNRMLSMESVKARLEAGGLTYIEFSYMVMQAYDFVHLHQAHGCTLQIGGQDQWGNIVMGIELGRRLAGAELAGLTFPLLTRADGGKFGKSEAGNIWLDAARTSPYDFYQFWRNTADADVSRHLAYFTFLPIEEVRRLAAQAGAGLNEAKQALAYEVTKLIHGQAEADGALESAQRAFGAGDVGGEAIPSAELPRAELEKGAGLLHLMVRAGLAQSNSEARRLVQGGGVRLNGEAVSDPTRKLEVGDADGQGRVVLRVGKKRIFRYDVV
ncbi:MAG: tyrosine--tRNA ligase [Phycisphaeraceae bacterium]